MGDTPGREAERKKKEISRLLKEGSLSIETNTPRSATGDFWNSLSRIKNNDDYEPFVQYTHCNQILAYEVENGTRSLSAHVAGCMAKINQTKSTRGIASFMAKSADVNVPPDEKRLITIACAKFCAFDMRSFASVEGDGFQVLCQQLLDALNQTDRHAVHSDTRKLLKTIGIDQPQQLVLASTTTNIPRNKAKKKRTHLITEEDVIFDYAGENECSSDEEEDEVEQYSKGKFTFPKEETM
ncbi:unnamed protein product [Didymodactylos carnosus]|uniref:Uncharacterized protein n=1 Tax=Didymodactylos carnosus TaxID=1234261 RepID=A0A8S2F0L4_9BILA|nr:unnamed protein product [Didymodactylos carnosus]CAF4094735.1 unnamed protein product [Didymodactylos carnosus]